MRAMIVPFVGAVVCGCLAPAPVFAASAAAPPGATSCSGCHATRQGVVTPVPRLAGRNAGEIAAQMQAFKSGRQPSTVMDRIAKGFSDSEVQAIAEWYAQQKP